MGLKSKGGWKIDLVLCHLWIPLCNLCMDSNRTKIFSTMKRILYFVDAFSLDS